MKFLIIGDLHGSMPNIYFRGYDAIIAPGDFCSDESRKYMMEGMRKGKHWVDLVGKRKAKIIIKKSLEDGRKVLEKLNALTVPVYVVPGNWDWTPNKNQKWDYLKKDHFKTLTKGLKNITNCNNKVVDAKDCRIIGYGVTSSPEFPQYKDELEKYTEKELLKKQKEMDKSMERLTKLFRKAKKPVLFLSHNVPFRTPIDKITWKESPKFGYHYGSVVVRRIIEKHKPLVSIGGHMHEHHRKCYVGKQIAINAGYGPFVNAWLEIQKKKIENLKFYKGKPKPPK
ncbi:metallophosphoesterase [Nanoarchaeota archaeon]